MILLILFILLIDNVINTNIVEIYHLIDNIKWGEVDGSAIQGTWNCSNNNIQCNFYSSDSNSNFMETLEQKYLLSKKYNNINNDKIVTSSLYNIHTWGLISKYPHKPDYCRLPTDLHLVESEESFNRFKKLFTDSFKYYDGNSTTHPSSSVQRYYYDNTLSNITFLPLKKFSSLIKGASYVASTCHRNRRDELFTQISKLFRIDSLGKCKHGSNMNRFNYSLDKKPVTIPHGTTTLDNIRYKQETLSNYLFYLAFENTNEPGYITEKVFDALIAGSVPIYYGHNDCKKVIPHKKAVIFIDDYNDITSLVNYLKYLINNETAYEEHRHWRYTFNSSSSSSSSSWQCNICSYAWNYYNNNNNNNNYLKKINC